MANLSVQANQVERKLVLLIAISLLLTIYGLYVEVKHDYNKSYRAMCDISPMVSCSTAFMSPYGKGLGILPEFISYRNPVYGLIVYSLMLALIGLGRQVLCGKLLLGLALIINLSTLFLGYILFVILKVFCLVCISIYVVNFGIGIFAFRRYNLIQKIQTIENSKRRD